MARGENQGLQIALIIFVMVALVLGVSTFYFFQKFDEERQRASKEAAKAADQQTKATEREQERDQLKQVIGVPANYSVEQVVIQLNQDMETYAAGIGDGKKNYRDALALQDASIQRKNAAVVKELKNVSDLEGLNEAIELTKSVQVTAAETERDKAHAEQLAEAAKNTKLVDQIKTEKEQIAAAWNQKQNELNDAVKVARTELGTVKRDLNDANRTIKESGEKLVRLTAKTAVVPDGRVVWVDQRNRLAWINLGSEDNLPRQQTFSVHPGATTVMSVEGRETDTKKAAVEVVRITGAHLAECRIIDYNLANPVVAGDKIFTPAWHPGRQQRFALGGDLDINGDGSDDRAQVKDIIGLAGGVIDLEILPSGEKVGEVTFSTTYFIKGDIPKALGAEDTNSAAVAKTLSQVEVDALNRGARVITLEQFLDDIGYFNRERIFRTGTGDEYTLREGVTGAGTSGFRRGNTSELFRKRSPPGGGKKSAY